VATATGCLLLPLLATAWLLTTDVPTDLVLVVGLCVYGAVFALDSSLHSWLVLAVAGGDDTVERVGFYYAANSLGRLLGTVASGVLFAAAGQGAAGLQACLLAAAAMVAMATLCTLPVRRAR
jgi:predicted MFS family arabinose efflux permease